jgi:putative phage-type endonuclease
MIERHGITDRASWLELRRADVTASDLGAVFGLHPYKSALALWSEKTGTVVSDVDNAATRRGRWLEAAVISACREFHPDWKIEQPGLYLRDADARLGATIDAIADERIVIECKTVAEPVFRAAWADGPPAYYQLQALAGAMLWNAESAVIAALVVSAFGAEYREYEIPRHAAAEQRIRDGVARFWKSIEAGETPKADYAADADLLAKLYAPNSAEPPLDLTGDNYLPVLLEERERLMQEAKAANERLDAIKAELIDKLKGAPAAIIDGWTISHRMQSRKETVLKATTFPVLRVSRQKAAKDEAA